MDYTLNRAWAEVNLDNFAYNLKNIKSKLNKKTEIMGVVKADAYGHGVFEISNSLLENGVTRLAVAMLDEAIELRRTGITVPILVLNYCDPRRASEIVQNDITQTVFSHDLAEALSEASQKLKKNVKVHIKIDTGMTRVGFQQGYGAIKDVEKICRLKGLIIEGLFTHFSSADEKSEEYTNKQFEMFMSFISELNRIGIYIPLKHVSNSAAIIQYPQMQLDIVRPGIILYGLYPSYDIDKTKFHLKPVMSLKANIILVKNVEKGTFISYGRRFCTSYDSKIATIPIGYADGYTRLLNGKGRVLVNGQFADVVGSICMDQCMIDVTHINNNINVGDEVVLFGCQGENEISADELAQKIGTINYEIVSIIGKRIPRIYVKNNVVQKIKNYLI